MQTLVHRMYKVEDYSSPEDNYAEPDIMKEHQHLKNNLRSINILERFESLFYKFSLFKFWSCCHKKETYQKLRER